MENRVDKLVQTKDEISADSNVPTFKQELEFELSELEKDYETMLELRVFIPEELNYILQNIELNKRILSTLSD